jgi:hypothetical protein
MLQLFRYNANIVVLLQVRYAINDMRQKQHLIILIAIAAILIVGCHASLRLSARAGTADYRFVSIALSNGKNVSWPAK